MNEARYGTVAITGNEWINARAQEILTHGLPDLPAETPDLLLPSEMENGDHGHITEERPEPGDAGCELDHADLPDGPGGAEHDGGA